MHSYTYLNYEHVMGIDGIHKPEKQFTLPE